MREMIGCGLMKQVDLMKERQWTDPDIVEGEKFGSFLIHDTCILTTQLELDF